MSIPPNTALGKLQYEMEQAARQAADARHWASVAKREALTDPRRKYDAEQAAKKATDAERKAKHAAREYRLELIRENDFKLKLKYGA